MGAERHHDLTNDPTLFAIVGLHPLRPLLEAYLAACAAPDGLFVHNEGSGVVHAVGCSTLNGTVQMIEELLDAPCPHQALYERCPVAVPAPEIRRGRRCRACCPDVTPPTRGSGRFTDGGGLDA